jgi:hypothetical protein
MQTGTIRKLLTTEKPLFRDHLLRLDAARRRDRFVGGLADECLVRYRVFRQQERRPRLF